MNHNSKKTSWGGCALELLELAGGELDEEDEVGGEDELDEEDEDELDEEDEDELDDEDELHCELELDAPPEELELEPGGQLPWPGVSWRGFDSPFLWLLHPER